jgi:hypothetical protein
MICYNRLITTVRFDEDYDCEPDACKTQGHP